MTARLRNRVPAPAAAAPTPDDASTWPVLWRVVAPGAGGYDHDLTFIETPEESEARAASASLRSGGHAVRVERVSCGPLPKSARGSLVRLRAISPQNPGTKMRKIGGYWEAS